MNKKMGRPPLPEGNAKDAVFAVKLSANDMSKLDRNIKKSGQNRADYGREALMLKAVPVWLVCDKWGYDDLQGKTVEYEFKTADGSSYAKGPGKFWVFKHRDGVQLAIEIHGDAETRFLRLFLTQELADLIERHPKPSVADFCCFAIVKSLQRRG